MFYILYPPSFNSIYSSCILSLHKLYLWKLT
jgi:hypothetical protein